MNTVRILAATLIAAACMSAFAQKTSGSSSDVVTIDQTKATNGGVTTNDGAGFPVTISQPGSYRLTSNLVVPAGVDGIVVSANNVSIDLNGFSITGPGSCVGLPSSMTCSAISSRGIVGTNGSIQRMVVRNGLVGGFGTCVSARMGSRVAELTLSDCNTAFGALEGSTISQTTVHRSALGGYAYLSTVEGVQMWAVGTGLATYGSAVRGVSMADVATAFTSQGSPNSALSLSSINATALGGGVQSVGANLCNGVAC